MPTPKFKKGRKKTGGREKGIKNKLSIDVQQTAFEIFEKLGGIDGAFEYFKKSLQNKGQFYNIFYKMLPSNLTVDGDISTTFEASEKFMPKIDDEQRYDKDLNPISKVEDKKK